MFGEFSSKFAAAAAAAPQVDAPELIESAPGTHPLPVARSEVDVYALTHNETSTGVAMTLTRPTGSDGLVVVDATSAAGGLRWDPAEVDVYYFAPQKCFCVRRRSLDRGVLAGRDRSHRAHHGLRPVDPRVARPHDRAREQPPRPDLQHSRARHPVPPRSAAAVDERQRWPRVRRVALGRVGVVALRLGREGLVRDARSSRIPRSGQRSSARSTSRASTRRPSRQSCATTASSTPTRTASSAATSCGSACSLRSTLQTSRPSPSASTGSSNAWLEFLVFLTHRR